MLAEIYVSFALCFYRSKNPDNNRANFCSIVRERGRDSLAFEVTIWEVLNVQLYRDLMGNVGGTIPLSTVRLQTAVLKMILILFKQNNISIIQ